MWFQMGKIRVGIYVFTNQVKERLLRSNDFYFDGKQYYGFRYIINEIDTATYEIGYCSSLDYNEYDIVIVSFTSYYDIYNLINEINPLNKKAKIIVGGQGALNPDILRNIVDGMWFGRGEGRINDILKFIPHESYWIKKNDPDLENQYTIAQAQNLIEYKDYKENSVGCRYKCFFCQYGWKNKIYNPKQTYSSGYTEHEDTIKNIDFNKYKPPYLISAIDGYTEMSRKMVNKNITHQDIINKTNEIYTSQKKAVGVKLYSIIGYPWEKKIDVSELEDVVKQCDHISDRVLNYFLVSTHFAPMPLTPMENEPINWHNFRDEAAERKIKLLGNTVSFYLNPIQITSPISAAEETVIYRAQLTDYDNIKKILTSPKYKSLKYTSKKKVIQDYFPKRLWGENDNILPFMKRSKSLLLSKKKYNNGIRQD